MIAAVLLGVVLPALAAPTKAQLLAQGDRHMQAKRYDQARAAYERALEAGASLEKDFWRARNLGLCYLEGAPRDAAKAAQWLNVALELRPAAPDTRFRLAEALAESGNGNAALEHLRVLAEKTPGDPKYVVAMADVLHKSDRDEEAITLMRGFLERNPKDKSARLQYASLLGLAKRYPESKDQYQAVLQSDPTSVTAQLGVARVTAWQKNYDESIRLYEEILNQSPGNSDALIGKGYAQLWSGRKEEARGTFQQALERRPNDREATAALKSIADSEARAQADAEAAAAREAARQEAAAKRVAESRLSPEEQAIRDHMTAARAAGAQGNYDEAIQNYRQVLERDPNHQSARISLARVYSWSRKYEESIAQYEELLRQNPQNLTARMEKARVMTWSRDYASALPEFQRVLQDAEASPRGEVSVERARLEYARALNGARRHDEALAELNRLLPEGQQPELKDVSVLNEKARAHAYSRRYAESIRLYDQAMELDPQDYEARMGKARTLYWSGRSAEAGDMLRLLLQERPEDSDANYMLATVERGRGNNARALALLDKAPDSAQIRELRENIRADLRPVLRLRYGYGYERDNDEFGIPVAALLGHRYTAELEFNIHPDVRMTVTNRVTQALGRSNLFGARFGPEGIGTTTRASVALRPAKWLRLTLGAGGGSTGGGFLLGTGPEQDRRYQFLYEIRPVITHKGLRLGASFTRDIADYTPLAIHNNVVLRRESVTGSYDFTRKLRLSAGYWHGTYSVRQPALCTVCSHDLGANGGDISLTPTIFENDRIIVQTGFRYEVYGFERSGLEGVSTTFTPGSIGTPGFFTPLTYQKYGGTPQVTLRPHPKVELVFDGFIGTRRFFSLTPQQPSEDWSLSGSFGAEARFNLGRFEPSMGYSYSSTESPGFVFGQSGAVATGNYRTHYAFVQLLFRF